ncbi:MULTISPECIES: MFS transporter [unclassified Paenibacillus]|uniref:MFS transporter n=1 Tax=unclassified Paenibacillus TaxID=185978 RepID=UPI002117E853|nr:MULTISPECIES: MFS transporter [unclassified Paenibacillus]
MASAVGQPVMGKLSDMYGRKRIFMLGLFMVTAASLLAPFSPSYGWLLGFRIIQAWGSASLHPAGMGLIRNEITGNQARALSVLSIFATTSAAIGPTLSGYLLYYGDWNLIFFVNFPVIVVSFLLALRYMPGDPPNKREALRLDGWGIALFSSLILVLLLFLLSLPERIGWHWLVLWTIGSVFFYRFEARHQQPFIDVKFLRSHPAVCQIYIHFILVNAIYYAIMFGFPSYLQQVRHFDSQQVGTIMLGLAAFGILVNPLAARWIDRSGSRSPLIFGAILVIAATLFMQTVGDEADSGWIFFVLSLFGMSGSFHNLGLQTALYLYIDRANTGIASGLFMTSRFIGTILSSSILAAFFGIRMATDSLHAMAWVCSALAVIMLLLSVKTEKRERHQDGHSRHSEVKGAMEKQS